MTTQDRRGSTHTAWFVGLVLSTIIMWCAAIASAASDAEIKQWMKTTLDKHFSQCGKDLFTKTFYWSPIILQLKDAQVQVVSLSLSEMDQLNGVQWRAELTAKPKAVRVTGESGKWSDWREPKALAQYGYVLMDVFQQRNEQRGSIGPGLELMLRRAGGANLPLYSPVPCNQIPPG
jgi:hypothetical protein